MASTIEDGYNRMDFDEAALNAALAAAFTASAPAVNAVAATGVQRTVGALLELDELRELLFHVAKLDVFSVEFAGAHADDLDRLAALKLIKYFYNLPALTVVTCLGQLAPEAMVGAWTALREALTADPDLAQKKTRFLALDTAKAEAYGAFAVAMEKIDAHAVFPTSVYRTCFATTLATPDASIIESVMGTRITTTIKIQYGMLEPSNPCLRDVYQPLGRCVAVVDKHVDSIYGEKIDAYFAAHGVKLTKMVYSGMEAAKHMSSVTSMLAAFKRVGVSRDEPVLIVGGGVITDLGGLATALYHRNTPYVMLCTSIVSGIDAGPSPRTCCDGFGFKNLFGAFHPPVLTLTDRAFFHSLHPGWLRHGIAEIIKMAVVKDKSLFELLEKAGPRLITTKFGTENPEDEGFGRMCDAIIGKAMEGYVRSEYGNLWETHQCRPHAYGHTWSPGYEIHGGMLHGHAVGTCMGYGAYLAWLEGFITEDMFKRIMRLISDMELALWHPVMDDHDMIYAAQVKIVDKRGGNLCAPLPRGDIGKCGYINDLPKERLSQTLSDYKAICLTYPRNGAGIDMHCTDVGLEPAGTVGIEGHGDAADDGMPTACVPVPLVESSNGTSSAESSDAEVEGKSDSEEYTSDTGSIDNAGAKKAELMAAFASSGSNLSYNEWIEACQQKRANAHAERLEGSAGGDSQLKAAQHPPSFNDDTLFRDTVELYATAFTTPGTEDLQRLATVTAKEKLFAPCMVGQLEGQFLKMTAQMMGAKRVLDVGTFTGYSALSFAEGVPADGQVVTIENDARIAAVADGIFKASKQDAKIQRIVGSASDAMEAMLARGEKFDIVFLDADKETYVKYYELAMRGLLREGGVVMADNSLCALVYRQGDFRRDALHKFNKHVAADARVEQTVLTVREGITMIRPVASYWEAAR